MANALDFGLLIVAAAVFVFGVYRKLRLIRLGQPEDRSGNVGARVKALWDALVRHERIRRDAPHGTHHYLLFGAFLIPLAVIVVVQVAFRLPAWLAGPISLGLELVALAGLYGTVRLTLRRYRQKPAELDTQPMDTWALLLLLAVFVTGFLTEGARNAAADTGSIFWSPVGFVLGLPLQALPGAALAWFAAAIWRVHLFLVLLTVATLPYGKMAHVIFGAFNIYFRNLGPKGAFTPLDLETAEVYGVGQVELFTQKQLLDLEACVRCGRCQARCPAHATDKTLNPKKLIQDLKAHWLAKAPALQAGKGDEFETPMIDGDGVSQHDLWSCTTCRHCMESCPMMIEHVDKVVDMRRHLVLMEGAMPDELITVNKNLENNFNPWGVGWSDRNDWTARRNVSPRVLSEEENPEFEYLLWVGCAGSYDDRYQRVVASLCRILDRAGVSYGVLGVAEKCCGDPARSTGNEYLYATLVAENIAAMQDAGVTKIIAPCPHCLKTLDKEYPQFGGDFEVIHHSTLLLELVRAGRVPLTRGKEMNLTFHDSCYLSRYAGITEPPRALLGSVANISMTEMERSGTENFCCGAGGGRMWMEEEGTRINNVRAREALDTGADTISTACPFCLTMLSDGVKAANREEDVAVLDLAEIIERAMT